MTTLLSSAAIVAWLFGAMLILIPAETYSPTGIVMTPMIAAFAQAHGATLIGLGVINWLARGADRKGLIAVLGGNLVGHVLALGAALRMMTLGAGATVAPGVVINAVLGGLFAVFLLKARKL